MEDEATDQQCKSRGLVFGVAKVGTYNSLIFQEEDKVSKATAIRDLLTICGSSVPAEELCAGKCDGDSKVCLPTTLQSAGNSDADLTIYGPDENGNSFYNLVIVGKGLVGWSALSGTCECMKL